MARNYNKSFDITKSDTVNFAPVGNLQYEWCDAIYVGGAGVVAAVLQDGSVQEFTAVAGELLPIKAKRVNSANTTATLMRALYSI